MPFTFSHAAAVIPLARLLPLAPLVVGCFAPDFEYFFWLRPKRTFCHDLIAIPRFCVPVGLITLIAFDYLMKGPLIDLCPEPLRRRLWASRAPTPLWGWPRLAAVVLALAIGALTHDVWDFFTHGEGWPALTHLLEPARGSSANRPTNILQSISTVVGMLLIVACSFNWLRHQPKTQDLPNPPPLPTRATAIAALIVIPLIAAAVIFAQRSGDGGIAARLVPAFLAATSAFALVALLYGAAITIRRTSTRR